MMVNRVKTIRQSLSTTIAANFHSLVISAASSSFRILSVIIRSSFRMSESSRCAPRHGWWLTVAAIGSSCEPPIRHPGVECGVRSVAGRKSSSMSNHNNTQSVHLTHYISSSSMWWWWIPQVERERKLSPHNTTIHVCVCVTLRHLNYHYPSHTHTHTS
jgi:hypothetical protein